MPAFLATILASKFFKPAAIGLAILALIIGGVWWVKHSIKKHDQAVVAAEQAKVETKALTTAVVAQQAQATIRNETGAQLRKERAETATQVAAAQTAIQSAVAAGELPDAPLSPVKARTIDAIEQLEADRLKAEAAL